MIAAPSTSTTAVSLPGVLQAKEAPVVLYPKGGGNIHSFTGITDCAVLDLLSPPYSRSEGAILPCSLHVTSWCGLQCCTASASTSSDAVVLNAGRDCTYYREASAVMNGTTTLQVTIFCFVRVSGVEHAHSQDEHREWCRLKPQLHIRAAVQVFEPPADFFIDNEVYMGKQIRIKE
jgi:hypothetical protein